MSFEINETEQAIVDAVEKVCHDILQPNAQRYDETETFCAESLQALGEMGCWGLIYLNSMVVLVLVVLR